MANAILIEFPKMLLLKKQKKKQKKAEYVIKV